MCCAAAVADDIETSFAATAAATFDGVSADFGLLEARAGLGPHLSVAAGVAYLHVEPGFREIQLRTQATVSATLGRWLIEDRNMISLNDESADRYRNRLRISLPIAGDRSRQRFRLLAFDELFFDLQRGRIERNNLAAGFSASLGDRCRAELYQVWSDNRTAPDNRYVLAIVSVTFARGRRSPSL
jgi:hypothetical protein